MAYGTYAGREKEKLISHFNFGHESGKSKLLLLQYPRDSVRVCHAETATGDSYCLPTPTRESLSNIHSADTSREPQSDINDRIISRPDSNKPDSNAEVGLQCCRAPSFPSNLIRP